MSNNLRKQVPVATLVVTGASQVLTCAKDAEDLVGCIPDGIVAVDGDKIIAVGSRVDVEQACDISQAKILDAKGGIVIPGFVDCHTHLVFAGSRVEEYAAKVRGADKAELAAHGIPTGIPATAAMLQQANVDELVESALERMSYMLRFGTTAVEVKSGYGLSLETELRMLEVNKRLKGLQPIDVVSTFLGAHEFPANKSREAYIDEIINEMIPAVSEQGLAEFNDVYCDDGYYTVEESRRILEVGVDAGLKVKIHTDAYSHIGGSVLAAELKAVSADHLNYTNEREAGLMRDAGVVGVVMPALDFAVGHTRPFNARMMMDQGMTLALATDICPGCWLESMPFVIQLACRLYKFSPAEALRASTYGAAQALDRETEIGSLEIGKRADIAVFDLPRYEDMAYRLGRGEASAVIQSGNVVLQNHH
ncbi:MAG: imidazolonepropionase [Rhodospirillales bacterium]|nr:imidazolonepropionase [Rhodospirillales bacterium]